MQSDLNWHKECKVCMTWYVQYYLLGNSFDSLHSSDVIGAVKSCISSSQWRHVTIREYITKTLDKIPEKKSLPKRRNCFPGQKRCYISFQVTGWTKYRVVFALGGIFYRVFYSTGNTDWFTLTSAQRLGSHNPHTRSSLYRGAEWMRSPCGGINNFKQAHIKK